MTAEIQELISMYLQPNSDIRATEMNEICTKIATEIDSKLVGTEFLGSRNAIDTPTGTGAAFWIATQAGTYTNFGGVVVSANSFAVISRDALGAFSISQTPLDITSKVNVSDVVNNLTSTSEVNPVSALQAKILNENKVNVGHGKNFIDILNVQQNTLINGNNPPVWSEGYVSSSYIEVMPETYYLWSGMLVANAYFGIAFYNASKTYLSGDFLYYSDAVLNTPVNCKYVVLSFGSLANFELIKNTVQLELGIVKTPYEAFVKTTDYYLEGHNSENIYNGSIQSNTALDLSNGSIGSYTGKAVTSYIPVKSNTVYHIAAEGIFKISKSGNAKDMYMTGHSTINGLIQITTDATTKWLVFGNAEMASTGVLQNIVVSELISDLNMTYNHIKDSIFEASKRISDKLQDLPVLLDINESTVINLYDKNSYPVGLNPSNGYSDSMVGTYLIPVVAGDIYTIIGFNPQTAALGFGFFNSSGYVGQLGNNGMQLAIKSANDLQFISKVDGVWSTFSMYGSTCYIKPPTGAFYMTVSKPSEYTGKEGVYKGIYYTNPEIPFSQKNLLSLLGKNIAPEFEDKKTNVLILGDSISDQSGQVNEPNIWVTYFADECKINKVFNFAQGGARWIREAGANDVTTYSETYANGDLKNTVSNQLRKYLLRYAETPLAYPIPNAIVISCGINDKEYYDAGLFDATQYDTVFSKSVNYASLDQTKIAGAFRRVIEDIRVSFGDVPVFIVSPIISSNFSTKYPYNIGKNLEEIATRSSCHFINTMRDSGLNFMKDSATSIPTSYYFLDGLHPKPLGAKLLSKCISRWYKFYMD